MKTQWLLLVLLSVCTICHADRDIVYSARYYAPPGSHRTSHFHIYRISPDGTGKTQLTFGSADEEMPQWSAGGRQIIFIAYPADSALSVLCRMDADGRHHISLKAVKDGAWPPERAVPGYHLENSEADDNSPADKHTLIALKAGRRLTLTVPDHDSSFNSSNDTLLPMPGQGLVYAANDHNSTVGVQYAFYRLNPDSGALHYLTEGQFLVWSPDGSRFCTVPGRDTTFYEHRRGRDDRLVWFAPLYVRAASGGKMRQLTPRLSYVTGADWRKIN